MKKWGGLIRSHVRASPVWVLHNLLTVPPNGLTFVHLQACLAEYIYRNLNSSKVRSGIAHTAVARTLRLLYGPESTFREQIHACSNESRQQSPRTTDQTILFLPQVINPQPSNPW